jgi:hypothetical protein
MSNSFNKSDVELPIGGTISNVDDLVELYPYYEKHIINDDGSEWLLSGNIINGEDYPDAEKVSGADVLPSNTHGYPWPMVGIVTSGYNNNAYFMLATNDGYTGFLDAWDGGIYTEFDTGGYYNSWGQPDHAGTRGVCSYTPLTNLGGEGVAWLAYSNGSTDSVIYEAPFYSGQDPQSYNATSFAVTGEIGGVEHYEDHLYVISMTDKAVRKYTRAGSLVTSFPIGGSVANPRHIALMDSGFVIMEETGNALYFFDFEFNLQAEYDAALGEGISVGAMLSVWYSGKATRYLILCLSDGDLAHYRVIHNSVGEMEQAVGSAGLIKYKRIK